MRAHDPGRTARVSRRPLHWLLTLFIRDICVGIEEKPGHKFSHQSRMTQMICALQTEDCHVQHIGLQMVTRVVFPQLSFRCVVTRGAVAWHPNIHEYVRLNDAHSVATAFLCLSP